MPKVISSKQYNDPGAPKGAAMQERCLTLGQNIRNERRNRNFTMEELVGLIDISESYLGLLERGQRTPSLECLYTFCTTFGVTPNDLLLPQTKARGKNIVVNDPGATKRSDNYEAALSLIGAMNEDELEYIVASMIHLKKMSHGGRKTRNKN